MGTSTTSRCKDLINGSGVQPKYGVHARLDGYAVHWYEHVRALWGYGPQDMGCAPRGGPAHKVKACTALLGVHRKTLYSIK